MLIADKLYHPEHLCSMFSEAISNRISQAKIIGVSSTALAALAAGYVAFAGFTLPLVIGVGVVSYCIPIAFFSSINFTAFKTLFIASSFLISGTLLGLLTRFAAYQSSVFLALVGAGEWIDAARRIAFTIPPIYLGIPALIFFASVGIKILSDPNFQDRIKDARVYYHEIIAHCRTIILPERFSGEDAVCCFLLLFHPLITLFVSDDSEERILFNKLIGNRFNSFEINKSIAKLTFNGLKAEKLEPFFKSISENVLWSEQVNYLPALMTGKFKQYVVKKFENLNVESHDLKTALLEIKNYEQYQLFLDKFSDHYFTVGFMTTILKSMDQKDLDEKFGEYIQSGESVLREHEELLTKYIQNILLEIDQRYAKLLEKIESDVPVDSEMVQGINRDFIRLRQDVTQLYKINTNLNKLTFIDQSINDRIKCIFTQLLNSEGKESSLVEKLQKMNSVFNSHQKEEDDEEYDPLTFLSIQHGFNASDCEEIKNYLNLDPLDAFDGIDAVNKTPFDVVNKIMLKAGLDTPEKMNEFCEKVSRSVSFISANLQDQLLEKDIYDIGAKHHMLRHECFNLIKDLPHLTPGLVKIRFLEAIEKAEKRHAVCEHLESYRKEDSQALATGQGKIPWRSLDAKIASLIYRAVMAGKIMVPIFLNPVETALGYVCGTIYCLTVRFGIIRRRERTERVLSLYLNDRIVYLSPTNRTNIENFKNSGLVRRIKTVAWNIMLALYFIKMPGLSFARGFGLSRELFFK